MVLQKEVSNSNKHNTFWYTHVLICAIGLQNN